MIGPLILLAPLMMLRADAAVHPGRDEFGRRCALRLEPHLAVMIEDEWYASPREETFRGLVGKRGRTGRVYATLAAASDATAAELDLALNDGRGVSFTLTLNAATYSVHACRLAD